MPRHPTLSIVLLLSAAVAPLLIAGAAFAADASLHGRVIELTQAGAVVGTVAEATIEFIDESGQTAASARSKAQGIYRTSLIPGRYYFRVMAEGFRTENAGRGFVIDRSDGIKVRNFSLVRGQTPDNAPPPKLPSLPLGTLSGRVLAETPDGDRTPIAEARITLRLEEEIEPRVIYAEHRSGLQREMGGFATRLPEGLWHAAIDAPGFERLVEPTPIKIVETEVTKRDFILKRIVPELPAGQGIQGEIVVDTKEPSASEIGDVQLLIRAEKALGSYPKRVTLSGAGKFTQDLPDGVYRLAAFAQGYRPAFTHSLLVMGGRYTHTRLVLKPLLPTATPVPAPPEFAELVVHVDELDSVKGERAEPARLHPVGEASIRIIDKVRKDLLTGRSGPDGQKSFKLRPGLYDITAAKPRYNAARETVEIGAGREEVHLTITRSSSSPPPPVKLPVEILVLVDSGEGNQKPLADATVTFTREGKTAARDLTDDQGIFSTSLPPKATYEFHVAADSDLRLNSVTQSVTLTSSYKTTIVLRSSPETPPVPLSPTTVTVAVWAVSADGSSSLLADATVLLRTGHGPLKRETTDGKGQVRWELDELDGPKLAIIVARKEGFITDGARQQIEPGSNHQVTVVLHPAEKTKKPVPVPVPVPELVNFTSYVVYRDVYHNGERTRLVAVPKTRVTFHPADSTDRLGQFDLNGDGKISRDEKDAARQTKREWTALAVGGGLFSLELPAGLYDVVPDPPPGYHGSGQQVEVRSNSKNPYVYVDREEAPRGREAPPPVIDTTAGGQAPTGTPVLVKPPDRTSLFSISGQVHAPGSRYFGQAELLNGNRRRIRSIPVSSIGLYAFTGLGPGTYYVRLNRTPDEFYREVVPKERRVQITTSPATNVNFTLTAGSGRTSTGTPGRTKVPDPPSKVSISGQVHALGTNEYGRAELLDSNKKPLRTQKVGSNGRYAFTGLRPGTYYVRLNRVPDEFYTKVDPPIRKVQATKSSVKNVDFTLR